MYIWHASKRATTLVVAFALVLLGLLSAAGLAAPRAVAADAPTAQRSSTGVTADALPTVQINGVVWDQAIVGNTVYAGGQFTSARPAGSAAGQNETPRSNLLAYDITTGNLITSFAPSLDGIVKVLALSPDKSRLYVGGSFTNADGTEHKRLVAYSTATGKVVSSFTPNLDAQVLGISVTNTAVYVGGIFSTANGTPRSRLAAFNPTDGSLLGWAPSADLDVNALLVTPDGSKVIAAGAFGNVNGSTAQGLAAIDATSGALLPWAANTVVKDYGSSAAMLSLKTDGTTIYGSGYWYGGTGNFEGVWAADPSTGAIKWLADCHGDTYDVSPVNGVVYSVSHHHNCDNIASFPEQNPRQHWRADAFTADTKGTVRHNSQGGYYDFYGYGAPSQFNWFPQFDAGTFTGQSQGGWTVESNADYVVVGGEFPAVNGTAQQGLVRFAVPSKAPRKQGNQISSADSAPTLKALAGNAVRIGWKTNWDRDDQYLTYQVRRSDQDAPVYTASNVSSVWWNRTSLAYIDTGLTPGKSYTYQIRENDPDGNVAYSASVSVTTTTGTISTSTYSRQVQADGATDYWRLNDPAGSTTAVDWAGASDLTLGSGTTLGAPGAIGSDTAATFDGTSNGTAGSSDPLTAPNTFTEEAWFKTASTSGGKIVGFGNATSGSSSGYDRQVYLDNAGRLTFGVYPNTIKTVRSPKVYNDNQWHHVVATLSSAGMVLYVDGSKVGADASATFGQTYTGYWRVGGDNLNSWPYAGSSQYLAGSIDDVAIYPTALTATQVRDHYTKSGRTVPTPVVPTDAYGKKVYADNPDLYWRLDDASGPTARDVTANGADGVYSGGVSYQTPSPVSGTTGTAATFDGSNGTIGSAQLYSNPTVYSEELWFDTTTTGGGKLIGFGDQQSGNSSNYDRHLYMENSGQLTFGTYTGQGNTITSPGSYNDGKWHHAVVTQSSAGMRIYVDGVQVASGTQTAAQQFDGYWRVGGDSSWAANNYFAGAIDEVAVYSYALSTDQVRAHYIASPAASNAKPTAAFTASCTDGNCAFDASASTDSDGTLVSYAWDFGDGTTGSGATVNHPFATSGTYPVTLTVTDNQNGTGTVTQSSTVTVPPVNQLPVASFTSSCTERVCSFDGTGSSDPDGTVVGYAWTFGDGLTSTDPAPAHTYTADGTYSVKLTVTDNRGGTQSMTKSVRAANNVAPTASFTTSCTALKCALDASASVDPDGSIAGYAWSFGDGTSGTGATVTHPYTAGGTYTIKLTVTDDKGATGVQSKSVTVAAASNQKPTASFSSSGSGLALAFDGSGSTDSDGTIVSYAWTFGDGSTGTGSTVSHTYTGTGSYPVTLTVTDNDGGSGSVTKQVVAGGAVLAADSFSRTGSSTWGTASTGGAWSLVSSSRFSTDGDQGKIKLEAAGAGATASLSSVSTTNANVVNDITVDKAGTGSGVYATYILRKQASSDYRVKVRLLPNGAITLASSKTVNGTETSIKDVDLSGVTYTPGDLLRVRVTISGSGTTTLTGKVWKAGTAEPASAQLTATDTTAALQSAGAFGIQGYLGGTSTNAPVVVGFDNLLVTSN